MTGPAALVWFKRDLRVRDHAPLAAAQHVERALALGQIGIVGVQDRVQVIGHRGIRGVGRESERAEGG